MIWTTGSAACRKRSICLKPICVAASLQTAADPGLFCRGLRKAPAFEKTVTIPQLQWDFMPEWEDSDFFLAPTHMNCDRDLDGKVVGTVERLGVIIAYIKDRRSLLRPSQTAAR